VTVIFIVLFSIVALVLLTIGGGYIYYYTSARKKTKPLAKSELEICRKLVRERRAYPFICKLSVKDGSCPCKPCPKLKRIILQ
jgi:hypothetical protein